MNTDWWLSIFYQSGIEMLIKIRLELWEIKLVSVFELAIISRVFLDGVVSEMDHIVLAIV